jgi:hypothetical protein
MLGLAITVMVAREQIARAERFALVLVEREQRPIPSCFDNLLPSFSL